MAAESLETVDEKTAESLFQSLAFSMGYDICKTVAAYPRGNLVSYEICFMKTDSYVTAFFFKEDSRTGSLKNIYMTSSLGEPPSFKMFLHKILNCSAAGWHIKFFNGGSKKTLLPAFSSLESLLVLADLNGARLL